MDLNKYTQKAQEALIEAQRIALELNHQNIEPVHLLMALLNQTDGVVPAIVTKIAGSPLALKKTYKPNWTNAPRSTAEGPVNPG